MSNEKGPLLSARLPVEKYKSLQKLQDKYGAYTMSDLLRYIVWRGLQAMGHQELDIYKDAVYSISYEHNSDKMRYFPLRKDEDIYPSAEMAQKRIERLPITMRVEREFCVIVSNDGGQTWARCSTNKEGVQP